MGVDIFPWLMWYIWKAKNDKCFNAIDVTTLDTLQIATKEVEGWKLAQLGDETEEQDDTERRQEQGNQQVNQGCRWRCQVDASWTDSSEWMGMGFVLLEDDRVKLVGHKCCPKTSSPLHAEAESLAWAMTKVSRRQHHRVLFETDCLQLVTLTGQEDMWPNLAPEFDEIKYLRTLFRNSPIVYLPRSFNIRADHLAKEGRSREQCFVRFDTQVPDWLALAASSTGPV